MPTSTRKGVTPEAVPEDAVPAAEPEAPAERALLRFVGGVPQVVAPFGELFFGEFVAAPRETVASLLATGLFVASEGTPPAEVRHP